MTRVISCVPIGNSGDYEGGWCAFAPRALASDYKSTGTALATVRTTTKPLVSAKVSKIAALTSRPPPPPPPPPPPLSCISVMPRALRPASSPFVFVYNRARLQNISTPCPGPAPLNLEIPPYVFMTDTKVKCTALIHARAAASSHLNHLTRF